FVEAERDCTLGLKLDSKNVKALWRRGIARRSLGKMDEAKNDFDAALKIDPANKAVKEELAKLQQKQLENPKVSTVPITTHKSTTTPAKNIEPKTSISSSTNDEAPPQVVSSKRVLIKEVENDQESELFKSSVSKKPTVSSDDAQPKPTEASNAQLSTLANLSKPAVSSGAAISESSTTTNISNTSNLPTTPISPLNTTSIGTQMIPPKTTLDFQRDWKSYSKKTELLYHYIKLIQPESLPVLFKSAFESDYMTSMLTVFREFYIQSGIYIPASL
ncbi:hypothetical protein BGZ49_009903, partial [Haplosporangium sp. Z 27]